jgi:hypothetical protein
VRFIHDATNLVQYTLYPTFSPTANPSIADLALYGTILFARVSVEQFYTSGLEDYFVDYVARTCGVHISQVYVSSAVDDLWTVLQTLVSFEIVRPEDSAVNATEVEAWREFLERAGFSSVEAFARETIDALAAVEQVDLRVLEVAPCFPTHAKCGGDGFVNDLGTECCRGNLCKRFDRSHSQCEPCAERNAFLEPPGPGSISGCCAGLEPCLVNRGGKEWGHTCLVPPQCQPPPSPPWCGGTGFEGESGVCPAGEVCEVVSELYHGCVGPNNPSEQGGLSMEMYGVIGGAAAFSLASLIGLWVCCTVVRKTRNSRRDTLKMTSLERKNSASEYTAKQLNDELSFFKNMGSASSSSDVRLQH